MKISNLIALVDSVKPNAFSEGIKISWLNDVWGKVWTEIYLRDSADFVPYVKGEDAELTLKPPHNKMFVTYLSAMIDFHNGEYDKYQNTMAAFNDEFSAYMRWYALTERPADNL